MHDQDESYWAEYTNLQHVKHRMIKEYLNGWFPKLGSWSGRIVYIDTHAGRGRHSQGQAGSPVTAIETFLKHTWRDRILSRCEVKFVFIEEDEENVKHLDAEVKNLGRLPKSVTYKILNRDAFEFLKRIIDQVEDSGGQLAPCFVFVDPYGFKIPCDVLHKIKSHPRSELLITLMWRELDMAMQQIDRPQKLTATLDEVFGGQEWQFVKDAPDVETRGEAAVQLLRKNVGAEWATYIRMLGNNQATRYYLIHLTDHKAGRDLMKEVIWKCCPDGGYYARKTDDPNQQYLILPTPDLKPVKRWLLEKLREHPYFWNELSELLREEIWLNKHLWEVVREAKSSGEVIPTGYTGKFVQKANPILSLTSR